MSKLTHSTGEGMDAIDLRRATEDGNEDLLPPMTDLERGPSSDGESAICATSLNKPSSQEGLKNCPFCGSEAMYDDGEHAVVCTNRIRCSIVGPTRFERSYAINQWNTRHPSFNDAIEAAAKVAETFPEGQSWPRTEKSQNTSIASAIRSLKLPDYRGGDSEKTAESGNCPSTLNTRTE